MNFLHSLQSEWLKTRRSAASWLCLGGGFFLPLMFLIGFLTRHFDLNNAGPGNAWLTLASRLWHFMAILLLPLGIVLAASLIVQLEYRNNGWKQLHTTPQHYATIFSAKLLTIILMVLKFFIFFNTGMLVAGLLPTLIFSGRLPDSPLPVVQLLKLNAKFFIACLPILTLQYLLSLLFRNFLAPIGIGLLMVIGALILLETWELAWINPYCYSPMMVLAPQKLPQSVSVYWMAAAYAATFTGVAFVLYRFRNVKG